MSYSSQRPGADRSGRDLSPNPLSSDQGEHYLTCPPRATQLVVSAAAALLVVQELAVVVELEEQREES